MIHANVTIKNAGSLSQEDHDHFLTCCHQAMDQLSAQAPSDSLNKLTVDYKENAYQVLVEIISKELNLAITASAQSPFMALERAQYEALERVLKWTITRKIEVA